MSSKIAKLLPLQNWSFVENSALRQVLIQDYRELRKIVRVGARKSAIVLCGGILEAVLVAKLSTPEAQLAYHSSFGKELNLNEMSQWGLEDLIGISKRLGYLDEDAQRQAQVVQKFRNYIHPNKDVQTMAKIDADSVASAITLLNRVIKLLRPSNADISPKSLTSKERFMQKLRKKCSPDELRVAEQLIDWADRAGLQHYWSSKWIYAPRLRYNGYTYVPLRLNPSGKFQISFRSFLKRPSTFRYSHQREVLRQKLNEEVLEHRIRSARVDGHCTFPLALLSNEYNLNKFLEIFDWVANSIRQ